MKFIILLYILLFLLLTYMQPALSMTCQDQMAALKPYFSKQTKKEANLNVPLGKRLKAMAQKEDLGSGSRFQVAKLSLFKRTIVDTKTGARLYISNGNFIIELLRPESNVFLQKAYKIPDEFFNVREHRGDYYKLYYELTKFMDEQVAVDFFRPLHEKLNSPALSEKKTIFKNVYFYPAVKSDGYRAVFQHEGFLEHGRRDFIARHVVLGGIITTYYGLGPNFHNVTRLETPLIDLVDYKGGFDDLASPIMMASRLDQVLAHGRRAYDHEAERDNVLVSSLGYHSALHHFGINPRDRASTLSLEPWSEVLITEGDFRGLVAKVKIKPSLNNALVVTIDGATVLTRPEWVVPLVPETYYLGIHPMTGESIQFKAGDHVMHITTGREFIIQSIRTEFGFNASTGYFMTLFVKSTDPKDDSVIIKESRFLRPVVYEVPE